jgi:hypothetical protein
MTVSTRRERRQQQRRAEQRRPAGGGSAPPGGGIRQRWIALGVVILAVALIFGARAAGVFDPPAASNVDPSASQYDVTGQTIGEHQADLGNAHVATGQKVTYPTLPPTSGEHWSALNAAPAPWGVKTSWLPWEVSTHNLEHGGIVIMYSPDLTTDQVTFVRGVVRQLNTAGYGKIVLEPWPDMPKESKVILTAWNWILRLPNTDQTQIVKFTRAHHGGAGEAPEATVG